MATRRSSERFGYFANINKEYTIGTISSPSRYCKPPIQKDSELMTALYDPDRPMFSLRNKGVVVTGGGRGIGRGITLAMAKAGADVALTGRNIEVLEQTAKEARDYGVRAIPIASDITRFEDIQRIVDVAKNELGDIDGWINNAGSADPNDVGPLLTLDEGKWDRVVDLNLKWTFFCAQAAARAMSKRGGSIVNISSRSASQPCPNTGQYGAAKAGVESLTATAAAEWGHLGIRVNAIAPGLVPVENSDSMASEGRRRRQIETIPLRRLGKVEDIGPLAVYFISDESAWVSGSIVQVTGGSRIPVGLLAYLYKVNKAIEEKGTCAS
jgi:NAD(P)-dependent dehydrogenase (short-subunit alcohol dehydrogenase family)